LHYINVEAIRGAGPNVAAARMLLTIELVDGVSLKLDDGHRFGDQPSLMAVMVGPSPA